MRRNLAALVSLTVLLNACATTRSKKFESAIKNGRCDVAVENIPENDKNLKYVGRAQRTTGTVLSYVATGAGYTADVVLNIGTGLLVGTAICAPIVILVAGATNASASSMDFSGCYPKEAFMMVNSQIGESTYRGTASWRCPDLTALSRNVRKVARCHADQQTHFGDKNAVTTINAIRSNDKLMDCITEDERRAVLADQQNYESRVR